MPGGDVEPYWFEPDWVTMLTTAPGVPALSAPLPAVSTSIAASELRVILCQSIRKPSTRMAFWLALAPRTRASQSLPANWPPPSAAPGTLSRMKPP